MRRILFIVNPISGSGGSKEVLHHAIAAAAAAGKLEPEILETNGQDDETTISDTIRRIRPDVVASVGGDGTLNLVARVLLRSGNQADETPIPMLGIVPAGSANGLATELRIPTDYTACLDLLATAEARPLDVIRVTSNADPHEHYCLHIGDLGLNARLVHRFELMPTRGMWSYARSLWRELFRSRARRHNLTINGHPHTVRAHMIAFANASRYGTGAVINPGGQLDDGVFELVVVKPYPPLAVLSITWRMFLGDVSQSQYVDVIPATSATIRRAKGNILQVDGETFGRLREVTLRIWGEALQVIRPV